jgi:hypothetical protein
LVTKNFLASDFCTDYEMPALLERCNSGGMLLVPLIVEPCSWREYLPLKNIQLLPNAKETIAEHYAGREEEIFRAATARICSWLDLGDQPISSGGVQEKPIAVDISRLPVSDVSAGRPVRPQEGVADLG